MNQNEFWELFSKVINRAQSPLKCSNTIFSFRGFTHNLFYVISSKSALIGFEVDNMSRHIIRPPDTYFGLIFALSYLGYAARSYDNCGIAVIPDYTLVPFEFYFIFLKEVYEMIDKEKAFKVRINLRRLSSFKYFEELSSSKNKIMYSKNPLSKKSKRLEEMVRKLIAEFFDQMRFGYYLDAISWNKVFPIYLDKWDWEPIDIEKDNRIMLSICN